MPGNHITLLYRIQNHDLRGSPLCDLKHPPHSTATSIRMCISCTHPYACRDTSINDTDKGMWRISLIHSPADIHCCCHHSRSCPYSQAVGWVSLAAIPLRVCTRSKCHNLRGVIGNYIGHLVIYVLFLFLRPPPFNFVGIGGGLPPRFLLPRNFAACHVFHSLLSNTGPRLTPRIRVCRVT